MSAPPAIRGCTSCGNLSFSQEWFKAFGVVLCNGCKAQEELIPKSTAKQLYLLTDGDLKKLGSIQKENPHQKQWNPMRLYMQSQVENASYAKHGGFDGVQEARRQQLDAQAAARMKRKAVETNKVWSKALSGHTLPAICSIGGNSA
ncbi:hypothetical protein ABBQ38_005009 [Trebouxia sp. C0009 RCD-2024]